MSTAATSPDAPSSVEAGVVTGGPRRLLRAEGAAVLVVATLAWTHLGGGWLMFALLFFAPDLSMLGYLAGPRIGAAAYNLGHSYLGPAALGTLGAAINVPTLSGLAAIWVAHIGFDRALGYGLKYADAFGHTHLGLLSSR